MRLFLLHSTREQAFVRDLATELRAKGIDPWLCAVDVEQGDNLEATIEEGLKCDLALLVLSPEAVRSTWTRDEYSSVLARRVAEGRSRLGVLLLRDCEIPELVRTRRRFDARQDPARAIHEVAAWTADMRDDRVPEGKKQASSRRTRQRLAVLVSALFFGLAPGTVAGYVPWLFSRWRLEPPLLGLPLLRFVGCLLIGVGLPVLADSFARFALQGLGTPAPVFPTRHLVVTGLYRHVRNPMYVAVAAVIAGQGLLLGNLAVLRYGAIVWLAFHLFVLAYEEPAMRSTFGAEYEAFRTHVPRWIPRLRPWRGSAGQS